MKAAVISQGSTSSKMIAESMEKYFNEVDMLNIKCFEVFLGKTERIFYNGKPLANYDCIYAKGSYRYISLLNSITTILNKKIYMPLKPSSFLLGHDKLQTHIKLTANNIPTPKTYIASTADAAQKMLKRLHYPIVMKIPAGTHGKGVMFADSESSASSLVDALALLRQSILIQEFIDTNGEDIRVIVVGGKIVAAMKRKARNGKKRANAHQGSSVSATEIDSVTEKIAIDAAQVLKCDVCAVDILMGIQGPLVLEVNVSPGIQAITKATEIDVAGAIAKYLFKKTKKFKSKGSEQIVKEIMLSTEIIAPLDYRGTRILLPTFASKKFKGNSQEEVLVTCEKTRIVIEKIKSNK